MSELCNLNKRAKELKCELANVEGKITAVKAKGEDVTGDCEAVLLEECGTIRLALQHKCNVIVRAGAGQALSLTSYAKDNGYSLKMHRKALRGTFFTVVKKG